MGSVLAFDDFCDAMVEAGKTADIQVNPHVKTRFRFGDGRRESTLSQADIVTTLGGKCGTIRLGALDTKGAYVPLLGSTEFLKKAGAVVDFVTGGALLRNLDDKKVFQLERSKSGLLMMDLTQDPFMGPGSAGDGIRRMLDLATE